MKANNTDTGIDEIDEGGTIAELLVPAEEIGLKRALAQLGGARIELEQAVDHGGPRVTPYLWVQGAEREPIEAAFAADESVRIVSRLAGSANEWLYRVEWAREVQAAIDALRGDTGSILTAVGTDDSWRFRALFPTREALGQAYENWTAAGFSVELRRIRAVDTGYVSNVNASRTTDR